MISICLLVVATLSLRAGCAGHAHLGPLPLTGSAAGRQRYRLSAIEPIPMSGLPSSWCLGLHYETAVALNGKALSGGQTSCGPSPAPALSGDVVADCERGTLFAYGGVRSGAGRPELVPTRGKPIIARLAKFPLDVSFHGEAFLLATSTRLLPASVELRQKHPKVVLRLPGQQELCQQGGEPFTSFP